MTGVLEAALLWFNWFVLGYFLVLNTIYLVLVLIAGVELVRYFRRRPFAGYDDVFTNPLTPAASVILPAHNEGPLIVASVEAMLGLRYPHFEVVVVDDGSTDDTFGRLEEAFDLVPLPLVVPELVPVEGEVLGTWVPRDGRPLVVVRKTSAGNKGDATNAGINASQHPLVCVTDADAVLDTEALLRVAKPFVDDPQRVVATGGTVRAANGSVMHRGRIVESRMPRSWLARIQVVEYLRSFLLGRTGWSRLNGLLIISGAFGLFRRDVLVELGGFRAGAIGEDADLVTRMHQLLREQRRPYRIVFVSEPVCWTEVPETLGVLGRQRRRWSRGLVDVLSTHHRMIANPRYGRIGVVVLPYYLLFECLGPIVELVGLATAVVGLATGVLDATFAALFLTVAVGYGILLSFAALLVEELSYHRYHRWRDLGVAAGAALAENIGYRQLHAWWRLQGLWQAWRRHQLEWGVMTRTGFATEEPRTPPARPA
jgi:cellulose synthase/poly-beta-1,6-N-acetylglucosamine synthase-like glycosyltransferase